MSIIENSEMVESRQQLMAAMNQGNESLQMEAISDAGYDPNAEGRQTPEIKISRIFARMGSVVIVGLEGDQQVEKQITINEAVHRSRALLEMVKTPQKYQSDEREIRKLLKNMVGAINDAKQQLAVVGFAHGV